MTGKLISVAHGAQLPNGATVLLSSPVKGGDEWTVEHQTVLCIYEGKYVTWSWNCREHYSGTGNYFDGNSADALVEAVEDFKERSE